MMMMIRSVALLAIIVQSASAKDTGGKKRELRFNEVRKLGGGWDEPIEVAEAEPHWDESAVEVTHSSSTVQQAKASKGDSVITKASKAATAEVETHSYSWGESGVVEAIVQQAKASKGDSGTAKAAKAGVEETHSYSWGDSGVVEAEPHWDEPEVEEAEPHWESHSSSTVQQAKASKGDSGTAKAAKAGVEETHSYSWGDSEVVESEPHWDEPEVEEAEPHWEPV